MQIVKKPADGLKPDPNQPRKDFPEDELRLLGKSVRKRQIHPMIVRPDGTIIDGERRWRAAKLEGLTHLDCIVVEGEITPAQIKEMQLVSAMHRADLTAYEQYLGCKAWLGLHPTATAKELAGKLDRDPSLLTRTLSLDKCHQRVKEAAAAGKIGLSHWYACSKAETEESQLVLLDAILAGASRDAAEAKRKRNGSTGQRVGSIRCPRPSGMVITVKGDATLEEAIEELQALVKEMKKAAEEGIDGKVFSAMCKKKSEAA